MQQDIKSILHRVANAFLPGDTEFEKILNAIALTESGGRPDAVGDGGWSIGLFQNHMRDGRGKGYTKEQLLNPLFNATLSAKELATHYLAGKKKGLTGADLAVYVSKYGQRPAAGNELHVAKNYGRYVGESPLATNEPQMMRNTVTLNPDNVTAEQLRQNEAKALQNLTEQRNRSIMNQASNQPGYGQPEKPRGIMDVINFILSSTTPRAYAQEQNYTPIQSPNQYAVKSGDTLWGIAQQNLGSGDRWRELGYGGNPNQMPVGTRITLPTASQAIPNFSSVNRGSVYVPPPQVPAQNYTPVKAPIRMPRYTA